MKPENWQAVIDINLSGVFYASKAAASVMLRARRGRIINMASVVGQIGNPGQVGVRFFFFFLHLLFFVTISALSPPLSPCISPLKFSTAQNNKYPPPLPLSFSPSIPLSLPPFLPIPRPGQLCGG